MYAVLIMKAYREADALDANTEHLFRIRGLNYPPAIWAAPEFYVTLALMIGGIKRLLDWRQRANLARLAI